MRLRGGRPTLRASIITTGIEAMKPNKIRPGCRLALAVAILFVGAASADEGSATPAVSAPPPGRHGFPFMSTSTDLAASHYVEQEFLFSGTAQAFINTGELGADGRWDAVPNPGITAAYTSRMLVRRPADPARFNGTVIVEWLNVTAGWDMGFDWAWAREELIDAGYAWVGVTAQHIGALALQDWEEGPGDRYASIFHPGDGFSYDIYSQAGRAIRHPRSGGPKPLGELTGRIKAVVADGESQSSYLLFTYYNAIHPSARVYDGFLLHGTGFGYPLSWGLADAWGNPIPDGVPATDWVDVAYPAGLRTDSKTPVMVVQAESDLSDFISGGGRGLHQQPDSKSLRIWEIAGTAHFDDLVMTRSQLDIDKTLPGMPPLGCNAPPVNPGRTQAYALRAAISALNRWVRFGMAPLAAPRLDVNVPDDDFVTFNIDPATGIVKGGLRLPEIAVPVATSSGIRADNAMDPPDSCFYQFGTYDPWNRDGDSWDGQAGLDVSPTPEPDLQVLYPSHADYVREVAAAALKSTLRGHLRPRDALEVVRDAVKSGTP